MTTIRRAFDLSDKAFTRAEDPAASAGSFDGHAAVFNQITLIGSRQWGFLEEIATGAFDDVLEDDVRFLVNHEGLPLARTTNKTLRLSVDDIGLRDQADLAPTALGNDVAILLARGDVSQQSFAFTIAEEKWSTRTEDGVEMDLRTITKLKRLYDVSVVTYPAYDGTDAGLRCFRAGDDEIKDALRQVHADRELVEREAEFKAKSIERALKLRSAMHFAR